MLYGEKFVKGLACKKEKFIPFILDRIPQGVYILFMIYPLGYPT
jgi:hypothetical protein